MNGRHGDPPVFLTGLHLLGVQPGRHLEEPGQGGAVRVALVVALRGTAQRAQVLEHALGVSPLARRRGVVAAMLVIGDEPALDHHRADHDVPDGASGAELSAHPLHCRAERGQPVAS